jgi:hypothetical protein
MNTNVDHGDESTHLLRMTKLGLTSRWLVSSTGQRTLMREGNTGGISMQYIGSSGDQRETAFEGSLG